MFVKLLVLDEGPNPRPEKDGTHRYQLICNDMSDGRRLQHTVIIDLPPELDPQRGQLRDKTVEGHVARCREFSNGAVWQMHDLTVIKPAGK